MAARGDSNTGGAGAGANGGRQEVPKRKKLGRPLKESPDADSPDVSGSERRRIQRRIANRESARRVRAKQQEAMAELQAQLDDRERDIASMRACVHEGEVQEAALKHQLEEMRSRLQAATKAGSSAWRLSLGAAANTSSRCGREMTHVQLMSSTPPQQLHGLAAGPPPHRHFCRGSHSTLSMALTGPPQKSPKDDNYDGGGDDGGGVCITTGHAMTELRIPISSPSATAATRVCRSGAALPTSPGFPVSHYPGSVITSSPATTQLPRRNSSPPVASSWGNRPLSTLGPSASAAVPGAIPSGWPLASGPAATCGGPAANSTSLPSAAALAPFSAAASAAATVTAAATARHGTPPLEGGGTAMDAVTWLMDQPPLPSLATLTDGAAAACAPWYDTSVFDLLDGGGGSGGGGGGDATTTSP